MNGCLFFMFRNNDNIADNNIRLKALYAKKMSFFKILTKIYVHIFQFCKKNEIGNDAGINHT